MRREVVALLAVALAIGLRLALEPIAGGIQVWLTFWPAVFLAAWFGGTRAGVLTLVASMVTVLIWFGGTEYLDAPRAILGGGVFALCSLAFCIVVGRHHRIRAVELRTAERHRALVHH